MKKAEMEALEKATGKLDSLHKEIGILSKKSPNDAVNKFKLSYVNGIIKEANDVLGSSRLPLPGFEQFDADELPSNSDVVMVAAQYLEALDLLRSANITMHAGVRWKYLLEDSGENVFTAPPISSTRSR
jgi:hypothetical protein